MVSIGPMLKNANSPYEKVQIIDVEILYNLLKEITDDLPKPMKLVLR